MKKLYNEDNLTLLTDFYELTMANGFFQNGYKDQIVYFDMFFRTIPDGGGMAIMAGVEQMIEYLKALSFTPEDIEYLRSKKLFSEEFLAYLRDFRFSCDVWAVPEGTPIFPHEPVVTVRGPVVQAQFIETMILLSINHQSLIATKANRIVRASQGRAVMEFGSRRAQGYDGAVYGARAAYIGGCCGTACTLADREFGIPALGTMAHSWVQLFDSELDAFRAYAREYPDSCTLLVDTYSTLKSGVPNAIRVFNEEILPRGFRPKGIRIDSGDITYLSKKARKMLDEAGFPNAKIFASGDLDEEVIWDLKAQGAAINVWGVGTRMITSMDNPALGGVYKLSAEEVNGKFEPRIKISENPAKITNPGVKRLYRFYDRLSGKALADLIALEGEDFSSGEPLEIFDPENTWKKMTLCDYEVRPLLTPIFENGRLVYTLPTLAEISAYTKHEMDTFWDEYKRLHSPHRYKVDLSKPLYELKRGMLEERRGKV